MTIAEVLPWVNLLLVPAIGMLMRIQTALATIQAVQDEHKRRLDRLEKAPA